MPLTPGGVYWPGPDFTFPPGASGDGGYLQLMAESVDSAMASSSLVLIDKMTLAGPSNTATFTDIPPSFGDLIIMWSGRNTVEDGDPDGMFRYMNVRMNGDGGAGNYVHTSTWNTFASATWGTFVNNTSITGAGGGWVGPENSSGWIIIPRYAAGQSKDTYAWGFARDGFGTTESTASERRFFLSSGIWKNTSVVNSVRFWPTGSELAAGTTAFLFGTPK